jgi:cobalt-zinc-cadmium efflux system outer membrane protein
MFILTAKMSVELATKNTRRWLPLICVGLISGCTHFQPQPLAPEKTAAQLESRRLDDDGLKKFLEKNFGHEIQNWPLTNWDLNSFTLAAFYFHPDLDVARAQWRVAEAGVKTAGARPNPSVSVTPGYDSQIPGNFSPWFVPVTFDVPIETAGKRAKRIAEARDSSKSAYWNLITTAWRIRSDVRASLLDYAVAGQRAGLLDVQLASQQQILKLLQDRFIAGEISRPELTTAQIALNKTRLDAGDAQTQRAVARSRLAGSLGVGNAALDGVNLAFNFSANAPDELTSTDARRIALLGRSDILGALADYETAEDDLRLQIAKQYPDLHLGPGYAWNSGNAGDSQWSLGLTLELPILDQNQGPIAESKARRELAAAQFTALQAKVIGEIDSAVAVWHAASEQMESVNSLFESEQQQQKSAKEQSKAGEADELDSESAVLELDNASLTHLDGQVKYQTALGALEDALQRPADAMQAAVTATALTNITQRPFQTSAEKKNKP